MARFLVWPYRYPVPFGLDVQNAEDTWDFLWFWKCGRIELASTYRGCEKCSQLLAPTGSVFSWKSLIVNALALARIWYVASLIHLPAWALRELVSLVFSFCWKGKPDLLARKVVRQPTSLGGFGVVSIELKACTLLVQWIRRFVTKPASWVHFFYYYCWHYCSPLDVLSCPSSLDFSLLPPFYNSLLAAWEKVNGGFSNRSDTLVICASGGLF